MSRVQSLVFAVGALDVGVGSGSSFEVTPLGTDSPELWYLELQSGPITASSGWAMPPSSTCPAGKQLL